MNRKTLQRLIWRQHGPVLALIVLIMLGSGLMQGVYGTQSWQTQSDPRVIASQVGYHRASHDYVDAVGQHYPSKQAFINDYRKHHLQVYRQRPTKRTASIRGKFGTQINQFYFMVSILAGVVMIWVARHRYLNEFLQTMGYRRRTIYRQQSLQYTGAVVSGIVLGSVANLVVLWAQIPATYFKYFSWLAWLKDLTGDVLVGVCVLMLANLAIVVINNIVIAGALTAVLYLYWWLPQRVWQNSTTPSVANELSRNWGLGISLALLIAGMSWGLAQWLVKRYSADQGSQIVAYSKLRLPLLLLLSVPLGVVLSRVFNGLIISDTSFPSLVLGWGLALIILVAWLYRPKWGRMVWQLIAQLR